MKKSFTFLHDILHVFWPKVCYGCNQALLSHEDSLCTACLYHLPFTDFHIDLENETMKQLWGKLDAVRAASMLYLSRGSRVETLLYKLKYGHSPEIGLYLGKYYARILKQSNFLSGIDLICPIPIHKSKMSQRGYNQATQFAIGLSEASQIPWSDEYLYRSKFSVSQTKMKRMERYENVEKVFSISNHKALADKHVLLVDDVLTTGATICSAGKLLIQAGAKVSVLTIARA